MAYIRLDLDTASGTNEQLWTLLESMLNYAESIGPKGQLIQYSNGSNSTIVDLIGTSNQVRSITAIVNSENNKLLYNNLTVDTQE